MAEITSFRRKARGGFFILLDASEEACVSATGVGEGANTRTEGWRITVEAVRGTGWN